MLLKESEAKDVWFYKKFCQLTNCMLIDIVREFTQTRKTIESTPIIKALDFLHLHFKDPITLNQISGLVGLTPTYFSAVFREKMKVSFKEYLTSLRLEYAAKLLIISDFSSMEICYASGFNDFSNFSRAFKKRFSLSPSSYRNQKTEFK
jgi:two-component system response regulator YesN